MNNNRPKIGYRKRLIQNLIYFAGLIFSDNLFVPRAIVVAIAGYLLISIAGIYLSHVVFEGKAKSSGSSDNAFSWRIFLRAPTLALIVVFLLFAIPFGKTFFFTFLVYIPLIIIQEMLFRRLVILDVIGVSVEFVFKVILGTLAINVTTSPWLLICTFLASAMIALGQRRNELNLQEIVANQTSSLYVLKEYSPTLLDQMISVVSSSTLLAYSLYTISERTVEHLGTEALIYTVPVVLYGILRFLYLIYRGDLSRGIEVVIFKDKPLVTCVVTWILMVGLIVYL